MYDRTKMKNKKKEVLINMAPDYLLPNMQKSITYETNSLYSDVLWHAVVFNLDTKDDLIKHISNLSVWNFQNGWMHGIVVFPAFILIQKTHIWQLVNEFLH